MLSRPPSLLQWYEHCNLGVKLAVRAPLWLQSVSKHLFDHALLDRVAPFPQSSLRVCSYVRFVKDLQFMWWKVSQQFRARLRTAQTVKIGI